jgi:nicotinamide-nucleotide amidase
MPVDNVNFTNLAKQTGILLTQRGLMLASAESCTGGWLGQVVTTIPGSSIWYERGFITYSNSSKQEMLGVLHSTIEQFGAVSEQTAYEMAMGAVTNSHAQIGVSITGIAGPDGGTKIKPVGTVCFAWVMKEGLARRETQFLSGDRESIRHQSVSIALQGVINLLHNALPAMA